MVQGAAAELFKMWAVTVRARCGHLDARIVLCLHDELLVHCPREHAETVSRHVDECLREAAQRWAPGCGVRFIADTTIVRSWSDAKAASLLPRNFMASSMTSRSQLGLARAHHRSRADQPALARAAARMAAAKSRGRSSGVK
jgi:hypothetical protein